MDHTVEGTVAGMEMSMLLVDVVALCNLTQVQFDLLGMTETCYRTQGHSEVAMKLLVGTESYSLP